MLCITCSVLLIIFLKRTKEKAQSYEPVFGDITQITASVEEEKENNQQESENWKMQLINGKEISAKIKEEIILSAKENGQSYDEIKKLLYKQGFWTYKNGKNAVKSKIKFTKQ